MSALQNNLDAERHFKTAKSSIVSDITFNDKQIAREILNEVRPMKLEARQDAIDLYVKKGIITVGVAKQIANLVLKQQRIDAQKKALNIKMKSDQRR